MNNSVSSQAFSSKLSTTPTSKGIEVNQLVMIGVEGVFRVENIVDINITNNRERCFHLNKLHSATRIKTYVPFSSIRTVGLRPLVPLEIALYLDKLSAQMTFRFDPVLLSAPKEIAICREQICNHGFTGLMTSYLSLANQMNLSPVVDRRLKLFQHQVKEAICEEISVVVDIDRAGAREYFDQIFTPLELGLQSLSSKCGKNRDQ